MSDQRDRLARLRDEAHATQHPRRGIAPLAIVEPDILERDRDGFLHPLPCRRWPARQHLGRRGLGRRRVEQEKDPLRRGHGLLQRVELVRQILKRLVESSEELKECGHHSDAQRPHADAMRARHEQDRQGEGRQELDRREVERIDGDRAQVRVEVAAVERLESQCLVVLPPEQLNDAHARDPLLQRRVDARQSCADVPVRHAHPLLEQMRREVHERDHGERRERETPIREDHHRRDREQGEEITQPRDHTGGEQLVQRLDVRGHACDEPADGRSVVESDREPLDVLEQLLSQVAHHALAEQRREHRLAIRADESHDE